MELTPPDPRIGQVLQGRYRILARVAAGAMGIVYRGERVELRRPVAVKFLHPWIAAQQAFRTRFETEARAMSRLSHPNCVSVIDFGVDGSPYLVMDFIAGATLRQLLGAGRLPPPRAVAIARQVLAGVAHAHAQGIIHRDLKPENLILGDTAGLADHVRILDFGLAKLRDGPAMTSGLAIGTPSYMSPEQTGAPGEIDGRTDIYAVGILLFEMLAGRKPFVSDKVADILVMHRDAPPPSLRALVPAAAISAPLEAIVHRALAKTPEARFQTAAEFAQALDQAPEAIAARAAGNFPFAPPMAGPAAISDAVVAPTPGGDKTIADPVPSHLLMEAQAAAPAGAKAGVNAAVTEGARGGSPGSSTATAGDPKSMVSTVPRLTRARWLGLGAVAAVALVLVWVGLRTKPSATAPAVSGAVPAGDTKRAVAAAPIATHSKPAPPPAAPRMAIAPSPSPVDHPPIDHPSVDQRLASADHLLSSGEWEQARVVLEKAHRENPQNAAAAYQLANVSLEHKLWAEGAQAARAAGEHEPKYRGDERLVKNLIRSLASDRGYEKTEDVLHGFGAGAVPFLKVAAASDKNPTVRQRAFELLRSRKGARAPSGTRSRSPAANRKSSSGSFFSR